MYLPDPDDLFKLTVDKVFPPPNYESESCSPFTLLAYSGKENLWDLVASYPKKKEKPSKLRK